MLNTRNTHITVYTGGVLVIRLTQVWQNNYTILNNKPHNVSHFTRSLIHLTVYFLQITWTLFTATSLYFISDVFVCVLQFSVAVSAVLYVCVMFFFL